MANATLVTTQPLGQRFMLMTTAAGELEVFLVPLSSGSGALPAPIAGVDDGGVTIAGTGGFAGLLTYVKGTVNGQVLSWNAGLGSWVAAAAPATGLTSFNGRSAAAVVPTGGDYTATQVTSVGPSTVQADLTSLFATAGAAVTSFNARGGPAITPAANDYSAQQISQLDILPVACATETNIALTGEQTIDGVLTNASRVLVWQQAVPSQNGIYVSALGAWTRAPDQNAANEFRPGVFFAVGGGLRFINCLAALQTTGAIVVGTTAVQYGLTFPPPTIGQNGFLPVATNGLLPYVNVLLSHTDRQTAQTASLAAITLLTAPVSDLYAVDIYLECTTAGAGTVLATISFTDDTGAATVATAALVLTALGRQSTRICFWLASGNISYTTTVAGLVAAQYACVVRAQRLWSSL
jgi:hypothetical protein